MQLLHLNRINPTFMFSGGVVDKLSKGWKCSREGDLGCCFYSLATELITLKTVLAGVPSKKKTQH